MKNKILLIMAFLSTLLGCDNKLTGPDFDHQENKVIVLNQAFRIDYQIPGNLSRLMDFEKEYKKQPKSISINNISHLEFSHEDWRDSIGLDSATWEYYRGQRNKEANTAADFSLDIDIHKSTTNELPSLIHFLENNYETFLNGENGKNTKIKRKFHDLTDDELGQWIVSIPEFNIVNINGVEFIKWKTFGEITGRHLNYYITPIDHNHYLAIYFSYSFSAKNEKELNALEDMTNNDIERFMNQILISRM